MNVLLGYLLSIMEADDYFMVNIKKGTETIFYDYNHKVPDEFKLLRVKEVYIDFASEALGIYVTEN